MKKNGFFKKTTKIIFAFLMAFGFLAQTNAASSSLNFTKANWSTKTSQAVPFSPGEEFHIKYVTGTNTFAYCNDYPFKTPEGVNYNLYGEITDPGKVYILSKAPRTDSGNYMEYYKYQVAYWIYEMDVRGADSSRDLSVISLKNQIYGSNSAMANEIKALVNGAKSAKAQTGLTLNTNTTRLTFTKEGNYYVSNTVKVNSSDTYKVSVNGPSGTVKEDVSGGFRVKVPVSSLNGLSASVTASVSASKTLEHAYLYKPTTKAPSGRTYQDMTIATSEPVSKKVDLSGTISTTSVTISKADATNGKEVPGAHLKLECSGNYVKEWISGNEPTVITDVPEGHCKLTETMAPDGYELSTETVEFDVVAGKVTAKQTMLNKPSKNEPAPVVISKADATTGEEVPGAKLELRNEKGELVEAWVSGEEPHKIRGLEPGKYFLTETLAPEGYELSTETVEFTVKEDGTVDGKVVMYNKPETVEVPNTSSFKTITTSLIGLLVIGLGSIVIYRNYKKNEE